MVMSRFRGTGSGAGVGYDQGAGFGGSVQNIGASLSTSAASGGTVHVQFTGVVALALMGFVIFAVHKLN